MSFGEELRRERVVREISLEEISAATKISVRLLPALEDGDVAKLPAPDVHARLHSRLLRGTSASTRTRRSTPTSPISPATPPTARRPKKARPRSRFWRGRRATAGTIVVGVTGMLLLLGLIAKPERRPRVLRATRGAARRSRRRSRTSTVSTEPTPAIRARARGGCRSPRPIAAPPPAAPGRVSLLLEFDGDSWTQLDADGRTVFSGLIRRGESKRFEAQEGFRLTLGNAGGVRVTVDGRAARPLGRRGQGRAQTCCCPARRRGASRPGRRALGRTSSRRRLSTSSPCCGRGRPLAEIRRFAARGLSAARPRRADARAARGAGRPRPETAETARATFAAPPARRARPVPRDRRSERHRDRHHHAATARTARCSSGSSATGTWTTRRCCAWRGRHGGAAGRPRRQPGPAAAPAGADRRALREPGADRRQPPAAQRDPRGVLRQGGAPATGRRARAPGSDRSRGDGAGGCGGRERPTRRPRRRRPTARRRRRRRTRHHGAARSSGGSV